MKESKFSKWINLTKELGNSIDSEQTKSIIEAFKNEIGEIKLDAREKEEFRLQSGADQSTADKWKTVSDVLDHVDIHTLSQKYPGAAKNALSTIMFIIGFYFPAIHVADGFIAMLPDSVVSKFVQFGASLTPTHLVNKTIKTLADKKSKDASVAKELSSAGECEENSEKTILFIVCKDDILTKFIIRLINSNDDIDENNVVGTKDGSVLPIILNEKAWLAQQSEEVIEDKVMFIGDIKDTETFVNATEPIFNDLGVKYGWAGNRAYIVSNARGVLSKSDYSSLLQKLQNLQIPDKYKSDLKIKMNALTVGKILLATPILLKDGYDEISSKKRQQLLYGISEFYKNDLSGFLGNV